MKDAVKRLVYTSADDCRSSLQHEDDLEFLKDALVFSQANEEKTKAKYIAARIRQLKDIKPGRRKWCARCGQRFQVVKPGDTCKMCGWKYPGKKS